MSYECVHDYYHNSYLLCSCETLSRGTLFFLLSGGTRCSHNLIDMARAKRGRSTADLKSIVNIDGSDARGEQ